MTKPYKVGNVYREAVRALILDCHPEVVERTLRDLDLFFQFGCMPTEGLTYKNGLLTCGLSVFESNKKRVVYFRRFL